MAVAFDAATVVLETSGDGVVSLTHTSTGTNRAVFAGNHGAIAGTAPASTSITYGGTGMTEMWDFQHDTSWGQAGYRLAGQATGAQTVTSTLAAAVDDHFLGVISMTGVDQTTPVGTPVTNSATSATSRSATVTDAAADDLIVDQLGEYWASGGAPTVGADQTVRNSSGGSGVSLHDYFRQSTQPGTADDVMSWSWTGATQCSIGAVAFKAAGGGGGRTTKNTRAFPLGTEVGMNWRMPH